VGFVAGSGHEVNAINGKGLKALVNASSHRVFCRVIGLLANREPARYGRDLMDLELLRTVSILQDLNDEELTAFAGLFSVRTVKHGEKILEEGTVVSNLYIVCDGVVHVRRLAQKREILLGRLGAGMFFGEINLFDPGVATASIYAMKDVRLAVCDYVALREFMGANPATGYKIVTAMMREMSRRLRSTSARLVNSVYWSTGEGTALKTTR
jgi:CRP/FNR family cyclic AMP-dependent transcriptional regulator